MNSQLVAQSTAVVLVLFFIFLMVMCWKTWRVTHVLFSFFTFAGALTFLIFASMVLKTQNAWRTQVVKLKSELEQAQTEFEMLERGDLNEVIQSEVNMRSARDELSRMVLDRGRVWRGCRPEQRIDDGTKPTFRVNTAPPNLPPGQAPPPSGISANSCVYVFVEKDAGGWRVPSKYLGEFTVEQADPQNPVITLSSMFGLADDQLQALQQANTTWVLYEAMPLDDHLAFAEMDTQETAPDKRRMVGMSQAELAQYIPRPGNMDQPQFDEHLKTYYRFNREANEDDDPQNVWIEVEFLKPHKIQVDVDAESQRSVLEGEGLAFDTQGRAVDGRLRRGDDGTVSFAVRDKAVFDSDTADTLIADGVAKKVASLFRRPLRDYARFFRESKYRSIALDDTIARVRRETAEFREVKSRVDQQIEYRLDEKTKLESDFAQYRTELGEVNAIVNGLHGEWRIMVSQLSQLYSANLQLAAQLTSLQVGLAKVIDQRTQPAPSAPPATPAPAPATPAASVPATATSY